MTPALPVVRVGNRDAALDTLVWRLAREVADERRKRRPHPALAAAELADEAAEPWRPLRELWLGAVWKECHAALAAASEDRQLPLLSEVAYCNAALTDLKGVLLLLSETPPEVAEPAGEEPDGGGPPDPVAVLLAESAHGLRPPDPPAAEASLLPATLEELLETLAEVNRRARWTHPAAAPVAVLRDETTIEEMRRWVQSKLAAPPGGAISTAPWFAELRSSPSRFALLFLTLLDLAKSQSLRLEQHHPEADLLVTPAGS